MESIQNIESQTLVRAENIINRHIVWAMASGALPIHFIDAIGVMLIQNDMIKQLCKLYGLDYNENIGKSIVSSIIAASTAKGISFAFKPIKAGERILMAILSGAITYAMGRMFIGNFEKGIALIDIDIKKGEELFDKNFEKGKEIAKNITKKHEPKKKTTPRKKTTEDEKE
ncbi:MAG: DUF697 domain-containing protein [Bacteroidales bacterium]|nr:DUF697 domain-containing protein [Bacteroidales bacterium]